MSNTKLAILSTHPIQYYAPLFRALAGMGCIEVRVFYTWSQTADGVLFDPGFGTLLQWDIPLLEGYASEFVPNVAVRPGTDHFWGLHNPTLIGAIEAWRPDVLLVYGWNCRSHLQALRHFSGRLPVLFRGDSTLLDDSRWWRKTLRRCFLKWVYRHVDIAIAVGTNNRDYFSWCGLRAERITFAPHCVDTARFTDGADAHESRAAQWRTQLGIGPDEVAIVYAGKLQSKKNPALLLEAFSRLPGGSHLVFFGNGALEAQLRTRAAHLERVHFVPFQNQRAMPAVYRVGDAFVLPSCGPGESWGLALNEAMASARAVIASSKVGGARDLVVDGINGWIFESGNLPALLDVLRRSVELGRAGLKIMGAAGQAFSVQWSIEECARRIRDVVIGCHKPR